MFSQSEPTKKTNKTKQMWCETSPVSMDAAVSLGRFDGRSRLLIRSLLCGSSGAHRAVGVFHRQQRADPDMSLSHFIETLCGDEVACPHAAGQTLTV